MLRVVLRVVLHVVLRVVLPGITTQHLATFTSLERDSASSLLLVRQPFSEMPALLCRACAAIWSNLSAPGSLESL